jgi:hypothetical protein
MKNTIENVFISNVRENYLHNNQQRVPTTSIKHANKFSIRKIHNMEHFYIAEHITIEDVEVFTETI